MAGAAGPTIISHMKTRVLRALPLVFVLVAGCAASPSGEVSPSYAASPLASLPPKLKLGNEGWKPSKPLPQVVRKFW